jgi:hypothetical protein
MTAAQHIEDPGCDTMCMKPWGSHNKRCAAYLPPIVTKAERRTHAPIPRFPGDIAIDIIREEMEAQGLQQKDFAPRVGTQANRLSTLLMHENEPSLVLLRKMWVAVFSDTIRDRAIPRCPVDIALDVIKAQMERKHIWQSTLAQLCGVTHRHMSAVLSLEEDGSMALLRKMWIEVMR